jgi:putative ABC transport system substrate-binding protein
MRRRTFVTALGAAIAWPLAVRAQQGMRRVGVLMGYAENDPEAQGRIAAFRKELARLGWAEGRNLQIDIDWSTDDVAMIEQAAAALVAAKPDVIVSSNTPTTTALTRLTKSIPVIFATVVDPVGLGFVASLPRPGGNVTGFVTIEASMAGKWLELLKEIAPRLERAAFLYNPATAPFAEIYLDSFRNAAKSLAVQPIISPLHDSPDIGPAVGKLASQPNGGFIVMPGPFFANRSAEIASLAARNHLPAVYPFRYYVEEGGLLGYGNDQADNYRRAAGYVDRILKGEKAAELPVQAPVKFELTINLKTAKALGLDVPPRLLQQADTVIE